MTCVTAPASSTLDDALEALRAGGIVALADVSGRHAQGYALQLAQLVTPASVTFMVTHARGLVCVALPAARCDELELRSLRRGSRDHPAPDYAVTVEARHGVGTGISAADRAATIRVLGDPDAAPGDLVRPGHIVPIRVSARCSAAGPAAATRLAELARPRSVAAICHVLDAEGSTVAHGSLRRFAARHGLPVVTTAQTLGQPRSAERPLALAA
jgi:3,4-dihydroxy 2-butanone 4-phosphate synthase/GTP cyclohydrolase II